MLDIAYLIVYNSHTGKSVKIPKPIRFHTLLAFKAYISQAFTIDNTDNLFILTSFGIKLNFLIINELNDVFIYDKQLFAGETNVSRYLPDTGNLVAPQPLTVLASLISSNLKVIHGWSRALARDSTSLEEQSKSLVSQINIIFRSLNLIFQFVTNFISEIEKNFNSYMNHIKLINLKTLHKSWVDHYRALAKFPRFTIKEHSISFADFLDSKKLQTSADHIATTLPAVVQRFNLMGEAINSVSEEKLLVDKQIEDLRNRSITAFKGYNASTPLSEIQRITSLIDLDLDRLSTTTSVDLNSVYKTHRDVHAPEIYKNATELYSYHQKLNEFKTDLVTDSLKVFSNIANLQLKMVNVKNEIRGMTAPSDTKDKISFETINKIKKDEDYLSLCIDLPLLFGFMMIEKRRQFEWYDFYSKGVVGNVSEQLSTIIDHEKLFRKIWLKKFGNFLFMLKEEPLNSTLPNIDVTLIGNREEKFNILDDIQIEREDILKYIEIIDNSSLSKNFVGLLNKNFKDLVRSTNNMKKITKMISALSTVTSIQNENNEGLKESKEDEKDEDLDMNLVKGLKTRIRKLENLLHQQQYKNITNWPVTTSRNPISDNRVSLIMDSKKTSPPPTNPTMLLQRRHTTSSRESPSESKVLDTSGIDKHLDNIRLKKENAQYNDDKKRLVEENSALTEQNKRLEADNKAQQTIIEALRSELNLVKEGKNELETKFEKKEEQFRLYKLDNKLDSKQIDNLNKKIESRDSKISEQQSDLASLTKLNAESLKEVNESMKTINSLRVELNDANGMKNDLLSNMSAKELEYTRERNTLDSDMKTLHEKIEKLTEDYEELMELAESRQRNKEVLVNELNSTIITLMRDIKRLIEACFEYFLEFCLVLESMGLLLVKEGDVFKITRVKGLRHKKGDEPGELILSIQRPSSKVIEDVTQNMDWVPNFVPDIARPESEAYEDDANEPSSRLISSIAANRGHLDDFVKLISFKENVQMQEETSTRFFLNAVSRRFRDVEGFAKRQTKDNKLKQQEIHKLANKANSKITVSGFQVDDLVLFLPTQIDRANEIQDEVQPWAAFNIGAPHYFLELTSGDQLKAKDWMIGRLRKITEHKVEEATTKTDNPFQLSVGVVWYLVEATEEVF